MVSEAEVMEALRHVLDADINANIVDLGLVYGVHVQGDDVRIELSMTAPGPAARQQMADEARRAVLARTGAHAVDVQMVSAPHWVPEMMNDEARKVLSVRYDEG